MAKRDNRNRDKDDENILIEKLVAVNRVAKVVASGRRFGFAALVVVGDGRGRLGFGKGKARELPDAVRKATEVARRSMFRVPLRGGKTLHHDCDGKSGSGRVVLRAAPPGTGIIAGGAIRSIFEVVGATDVVSKSLGSANPYNMVLATAEALKNSQSPRAIAFRRGKKVHDILKNRPVTASMAAGQE